MSDKKISELNAASTLADTDMTALVQGTSPSLETRRATLAQLRSGVLTERALHVRNYGAVGDGATDDTAAIQAAIDAAAAQGGGTVLLGPRRYAITSAELVVKENVQLTGQLHQGGWRTNGDFSTVRYALILNSSRTIRMQRNAGLHGIAILRAGLTAPTSLRAGLDAAAAFAGTAVTIGAGVGGNSAGNGADTVLTRLLILGFNWGIYSDANARVRIADVLGDCTNGLYLGRSYDVSRISEVNWHPLVTTARTWSNTRVAISAVANNGSGLFRITTASAHGLSTGDLINIAEVRTSGAPTLYGRWTVTAVSTTQLDLQGSTFASGWSSGGAIYINPNRRLGIAFAVNDADMASFENCFEYGHEIGFDIQNACHSCHFDNIGTDGWVDMADPNTIGIRINGTSLRTKVVGGFISSKGCSVQVSTTGAELHEIIGVNVTGGARRIAEVLSGQISFTACDFTGAPGTSNVSISAIHLGGSAGNVMVNGCDTTAVTFTADSAAAMQRLVLLGNRPATAATTTHRIAAGQLELATVSDSAAVETRLSISTSGTVTLTGPLVLPANPTANLQAAPKQYVDSQFTSRALASLVLSAATTVTFASHNARLLIANSGTTLSLAWANTGDGFSCSVVNRTGSDMALTLTGFTTATPANSDGFTRIRAGGIATLLVYSPDGGTTRICHLSGAGAP